MNNLKEDAAARDAGLEIENLLPRVLPIGWTDHGIFVPPVGRSFPMRRFSCATGPITVLVSLDALDDGAGVWLHSSTSRQGRLPTWDDLKRVHEVIHRDRPVVQLLPPKSSWLSIANCLHLFERLDRDTVSPAWRRRRRRRDLRALQASARRRAMKTLRRKGPSKSRSPKARLRDFVEAPAERAPWRLPRPELAELAELPCTEAHVALATGSERGPRIMASPSVFDARRLLQRARRRLAEALAALERQGGSPEALHRAQQRAVVGQLLVDDAIDALERAACPAKKAGALGG